MSNLRPLQMIDKGGLISYWSKGPQNNYSSVKRILGVVKFPPNELDRYQSLARKSGFNLTVGATPAEVSGSSKTTATTHAVELHPIGAIDKALGILKTASAEWVINCVNGRLIDKRSARFIGISSKDGFPYWIEQGSDINDSPVAHPSVFGDNKPAPRRIDSYVRKAPTHTLESLVSKLQKEVSK